MARGTERERERERERSFVIFQIRSSRGDSTRNCNYDVAEQNPRSQHLIPGIFRNDGRSRNEGHGEKRTENPDAEIPRQRIQTSGKL